MVLSVRPVPQVQGTSWACCSNRSTLFLLWLAGLSILGWVIIESVERAVVGLGAELGLVGGVLSLSGLRDPWESQEISTARRSPP